ncbi:MULTISPECIES: OmpA family protein [Stenotrophomonas]|jgi:OOP family OmpA-OmpF porin|nr:MULTISPECIES: OmpA family protein [Stenotrophomonas]MBD3827062.1 OmpA family protein [Stenotrophomonas sp.]QIO88394.1 cell envelope biogenesis protein OmpA [Stenotrophomonas rhizophila]
MRLRSAYVLVLAVLTSIGSAAAAGQAAPAAAGTERPVVIEGVVPDQATKARLLKNLREVYGAERVVDRVQVESIATPPNWGDYVAGMINPGLKRVSPGKLEINGQSVRVSGEVGNEALRQQVASDLSLASNTSYTVTNALKVGSQQKLLDQTLANRIIEFQSGSAKLTPLGMRILDEMSEKMVQMGDTSFVVIGHTDNVGQRESNLALSHARAQAVKAYLVQKGIAANHLDVVGKGPDEPVADNASLDGRARNRRIEFKIQ